MVRAATVVLAASAGVALAAADEPPTPATDGAAPASAPATPTAFAEPVAEAAAEIEMVPVPGPDDGSIPTFWISRTEIPWEVYDVFVYRLDLELEDEAQAWADTESRPSKPYLPPDRGFGHQGYAAISLTHHAATKFCAWLSERTGRTYRLPTEDEWERAARLRPDGTLEQGPFVNGVDRLRLPEVAWFRANARGTPHPVGRRTPTPLGLHDMLGNVAEWVDGRDGEPTTKGGSWRDSPNRLRIDASTDQTPAWNSSDPQIPKSRWWLSDGPMVGFRIVCEGPAPAGPAGEAAGATDSPDAPDVDPNDARAADGPAARDDASIPEEAPE